jgi:hypothetical protein
MNFWTFSGYPFQALCCAQRLSTAIRGMAMHTPTAMFHPKPISTTIDPLFFSAGTPPLIPING